MKIINFYCVVFTLLVSCNTSSVNTEEDTSPKTTVTMSKADVDLGNVIIGENKTINYYIKNTTNIPLIIDSVKSGCSCTIAEFTHQPILQNDSGLIIARFESKKGMQGYFSKSIVVLANTKPMFTVLNFSGNLVSDTLHLYNKY